MADDTARVVFGADIAELKAKMDEAAGAIKGAATTAANSMSSMVGGADGCKQSFLSLAGAMGIATTATALLEQATRSAINFMVDCVKAAMDEAAEIRRLDEAIKSFAGGAAGATSRADAFVNSLIRAGASEAEARQGLMTMLPVTHDMNRAMDAAGLAWNMAEAKGISYGQAMSTVSRLLNNQSRALIEVSREYGIQIDKTRSQSEQFEQALQGLSSQYGLMARAMDQNKAAVAVARQEWDTFKETIGASLLTPLGDCAKGLDAISQACNRLSTKGPVSIGEFAAKAIMALNPLLVELKLAKGLVEGVGNFTGLGPGQAALKQMGDIAEKNAASLHANKKSLSELEEEARAIGDKLQTALAPYGAAQKAAAAAAQQHADALESLIERFRLGNDEIGRWLNQADAIDWNKFSKLPRTQVEDSSGIPQPVPSGLTEGDYGFLAAADAMEARALQLKQMMNDVAQSIASGFGNAIQGIIMGTMTMAQAFRQIFSQILSVIINFFTQWLAKQIATLMAGSAAHKATAGTNAAASAGEGAAAAGASAAKIPYVGWILAIGAAIAMFALLSGYASKTKSAAGGYDIPLGVNPMVQAHGEEMVLPANLSNRIRAMSEIPAGAMDALKIIGAAGRPMRSIDLDTDTFGNRTGGGEAPVNIQFNPVLSSLDGPSVRQMLVDHGPDLAESLAKQYRDFVRM